MPGLTATSTSDQKNSPAASGAAGRSFGKKRGRKKGGFQRLTASAVFHVFRIMSEYDRGMTILRTIREHDESGVSLLMLMNSNNAYN